MKLIISDSTWILLLNPHPAASCRSDVAQPYDESWKRRTSSTTFAFCELASNLDPTPIVHQIVEAEAEFSFRACSIGVQP